MIPYKPGGAKSVFVTLTPFGVMLQVWAVTEGYHKL